MSITRLPGSALPKSVIHALGALALLLAAGCEPPPEGTEDGEQDLTFQLNKPASSFTQVTSTAGSASAAAAHTPRIALGYLPRGSSVQVDSCGTKQGASVMRIARLEGGAARATSGVASRGCFFKVGAPPGPGSGEFYNFTVPQDGEYVVLSGCSGDSSCTATVTVSSRTSLEERWAPSIYQDVWEDSWFTKRYDHITKVNFDGDYDGLNNDNNVANHRLPAHVYTSKVETETHWFVGYYFYHPRDYKHREDNDLEGVLMSIRKEGLFGRLESWMTQAHGHPTAAMDRNALPGCYSLGMRNMTWGWGDRPAVYVEPQKHGVYDCTYKHKSILPPYYEWVEADCGDNDGVLYVYKGGTVDVPGETCGDGSQTFRNTTPCGYGLIPLEAAGADRGFWDLRDHKPLFPDRGVFAGGEANPPWAWAAGKWLQQPAQFFAEEHWNKYLNCPQTDRASRNYVRQPYTD